MFNIEIENLKGETLEEKKGLTVEQAMHELANYLDGASYVSKVTVFALLCLRVEKYGTPGFFVTVDSDENANAINSALIENDKPINL